VTVTFEKKNRSFERLLLAPIPLELLMLAKTSGAILFGMANAFVPVIMATFLADLSGLAWGTFVPAVALIAVASTFLGLFIAVAVSEVFEADSIADEVAGLPSTAGLTVDNWIDANEDLFSALASQGASSYMIQTFVLMSVVIGIASILSITVLQKSRQIGILKAMGIKDRASSLIFLSQGLFLGLGGAVLGMALGTVLFLGFLQGISQSGDTVISSDLNYVFILASGLVATLAALGASLLPAAKSRNLDPIEVIRNG